MAGSVAKPEDGSEARRLPDGRSRRYRVAGALAIVAVGLVVRAGWLNEPGKLRDQELLFFWAFLAQEEGPASVYEEYEHEGRVRRWSNYPPVHILSLRAIAAVYPLVAGRPYDEEVVREMSVGADTRETRIGYVLFKLPALLADLATGVLLFCWLSGRRSGRVGLGLGLLYVLHPAVIHNSAIWAQVDSVHTLWMVLSLEAAVRRKPGAMTAWAVLAVLTKVQAILLAPIWIVVLIFGFGPVDAGRTVRRVGRCAIVAAVLLAPVVAIFGSGPGAGVYHAYFGAVGYYPYLHVNGFSAWFFANPMAAPSQSPDYLRDYVPFVAGLSGRTIGMSALCAAAAAVAVVMWRRRCDDGVLRWAARLLPLAFFVLPTQIHERYLFPAIALWAWGFEPRKRWWALWVVIGACASINAMWVFSSPNDWGILPAIGRFLTSTHPGLPTGVWCAAVLTIVLGAEAAGAFAGDGLGQANAGRDRK